MAKQSKNYWRELFRLNARPLYVCQECKHYGGWYDREACATFVWCEKYHDYCGSCKRRCKELRKGLLRLIKEAVKE